MFYKKITSFTEIKKYILKNVHCTLQIKNMSYDYQSEKNSPLKHSNIFIQMHLQRDLFMNTFALIFDFKQVQFCV